jgi:tRNA (adenine57-N1/adenine58-N1)-methyltransferase catalytic subunit
VIASGLTSSNVLAPRNSARGESTDGLSGSQGGRRAVALQCRNDCGGVRVGMLATGPLRDGDIVVFVDSRRRRHLKRLRAGHRITIRGTVIESSAVIGAAEGTLAGAGESEQFLVFRPRYAEVASTVDRPAEPVFAKDAGSILIHAGIGAETRVVEAGVGAGTLTVALLAAVGRHGAVTSYEVREDFAEAARRTVAAHVGEAPHWRLVVRDATTGFDERDVDAVVADVPDPDALLDAVARALRPGGTFAAYVPTILQVKQLHDALVPRADFALAETIELLERAWRIAGRSVRPEQRMIAHTGFLTFVRRTAEDVSR